MTMEPFRKAWFPLHISILIALSYRTRWGMWGILLSEVLSLNMWTCSTFIQDTNPNDDMRSHHIHEKSLDSFTTVLSLGWSRGSLLLFYSLSLLTKPLQMDHCGWVSFSFFDQSILIRISYRTHQGRKGVSLWNWCFSISITKIHEEGIRNLKMLFCNQF